MVICQLQRRGTTNISERHVITSIYQKFLEIGSVGDCTHTKRPSIVTGNKIQDIQQILDTEPVNSIRSVTREANFSRYLGHQVMWDLIGYKPYMMHSVQQRYDEDMDLRVEMPKHLMPILEDRRNDSNVINQPFTFVGSWINIIAELEQQPILSVTSKLLWIFPKWAYGVQCLTSKSLIHTFLKMKQSTAKLPLNIKKLFLSNYAKKET